MRPCVLRSDWLAEELGKASRQRAAALGQAAGAEKPGGNADWEPVALDFFGMPLTNLDRNQFIALVKNIKMKKSKKDREGKRKHKKDKTDKKDNKFSVPCIYRACWFLPIPGFVRCF